MFFGSRGKSLARRRGVVLILILGMLALMALIGVTFATFAGQSLVNSRNFAAGVNWPGSEQLMDYALAQLINDTNNPLSGLRGHGILRDMYGNDSVVAAGRYDQYRILVGGVPVPQVTGSGAATRALVTALPNGTPLTFGNFRAYPVPDATKPFNFQTADGINSQNENAYEKPGPTYKHPYLQFQTNIPAGANSPPSLYGVDFTRWVVRVRGVAGAVAATYEVVEDDPRGTDPFSGGAHLLTLSQVDYSDSTNTSATRLYSNPDLQEQTAGTPNPNKTTIFLNQPINGGNGQQFVLDGRYRRAFNGTGMSAFNFVGMPAATYGGAGQPHNNAALANFRVNGQLLPLAFGPGGDGVNPPSPANPPNPPTLLGPQSFGDPNTFGMDEDYDACDLENWFLALQSADGSVMIPSFHRPGILTASDWTNTYSGTGSAADAAAIMSMSKILRPRAVDNYTPSFPADPTPDPNSGQITYDVDNDGDGVTDSVWLDLGYPSLRDPRGQTFKPLFAFMVLGLNGRLPLNTAGNLQSRDFQRPLAGTGPVPFAEYYPQNYTDGATWSHASHLGYSVNEVNPMYALQNAPNLVYGIPTVGSQSNFMQFDSSGYDPTNNPGGIGDRAGSTPLGNSYNRILGNVVLFPGGNGTSGQNAGVGVDIVQLRNLLAGTIAPSATGSTTDANTVTVNGIKLALPNSMFDTNDTGNQRSGIAVPGRWGESNAIPTFLDQAPTSKTTVTSQVTSVYPIYTNAIRAGKSAAFLTNGIFTTGGDGMDDDGDSFDFYPFTTPAIATPYSLGEGFLSTSTTPNTSAGDVYDAASALALPVERIRRFVTPIDPSGNGRTISWSDGPPINAYDYGNGYDKWGRTTFFRYFRPAGMPKMVAYDPTIANNFWNGMLPSPGYKPGVAGSEFEKQIASAQVYNQPMTGGPVLNTSQTNANVPPPPAPLWAPAAVQSPPFYDVTTNVLHGWQSMAAPLTFVATTGGAPSETGPAIASVMPYDWSYGAYPGGYANTPLAGATNPYGVPAQIFPVINTSTAGPGTYSPGTMTVLVNSGQGPLLTQQPLLPNGSPTQYDTTNYLPQTVTGLTPNFFTGSAGQVPSVVGAYPTYPATRSVNNTVLAMPSDGLNKNEADEMNLYAPNPFDMPFGPADLEWLYRLQDVDGAQLTSRLQYLAPISFTNTADGLTRRRLFSTDSWEPIASSFAPDNPPPLSYDFVNGAFTDPSINYFGNQYSYNSRFSGAIAGVSSPVSGSLAAINFGFGTPTYQNPLAILNYPNPVSYPASQFGTVPAGGNFGIVSYPIANPGVQLPPLVGPSVGARDRRINLNYPLPVSNDPAEPVRQKWIRETYQYFKSILPPQAIDTPQELAQLSQYVVNIIDFRDPDCSNTRFVNTDLIMIPATATQVSQLAFADRPVPMTATTDTSGNFLEFVHYPFDPTIYDEQMRAYLPATGAAGPLQMGAASGAALQTDWQNAMTYPVGSAYAAGPPPNTVEFLVQHGMEYNPLALNEVMAYQYVTNVSGTPGPNTGTGTSYFRLAVEVLNMLSDDGTVAAGTASSSDMTSARLDGWDMVVTLDNTGYGRPDPVTGELPMPGLVAAQAYPPPMGGMSTSQFIITAPAGDVKAPAVQPSNAITQVAGGSVTAPGQFTANINAMRDSGPGTMGGTGKIYYVFSSMNPSISVESPALLPAVGATAIDASLPSNFAMPPLPPAATPLGIGTTEWCWLHLRRPANPFDLRPYAYREMVTVDSIRFPFTYSDAKGGTPITVGTPPTQLDQPVVPAGKALLFSIERYQPFRGGHLVPPLANPSVPGSPAVNTFPISPPPTGGSANPPPYDPTAWGNSEQSTPGTTNPTGTVVYYGNDNPSNTNKDGKVLIPAASIGHSLGTANSPVDAQWDFFPFNDRDFMSPAELLLVPGCPPGLFTKRFVEDNNPYNHNTPIGVANSILNPFPTAATPVLMTSTTKPASHGALSATAPRTYPYLVDKFYYSAATVAPPATLPNGWVYPNLVGGWTGDGWYKMFEFVEVPSSANGSIGTVAAGENFDWFRQDLKPGLLNLNLIIDEEVFFGLLDDPRLNDALNSLNPGTTAATKLPQIVTQINAAGYPAATYPISSVATNNLAAGVPFMQGRGYTFFDPLGIEQHGIKAAFSDFLKLRAGGSGFLFAWGSGTTGSGPYDTTVPTYINSTYGTTPATPFTSPPFGSAAGFPVARERPYRSFMAPDINDTIMRPATPPPSQLTFPQSNYGPGYTGGPQRFAGTYPAYSSATLALYGDPAPYIPPNGTDPGKFQSPASINPATGNPYTPGYVGDQGIRNPFLTAPSLWTVSGTGAPLPANYQLFPPVIPMRRLFQVPDSFLDNTAFAKDDSGAGEFPLGEYQAGLTATPPYYPYQPNQPIYLENLYYPVVAPTNTVITNAVGGYLNGMTSNLFAYGHNVVNPGSNPLTFTSINHDLGGGLAGGTTDRRQHPYYRTEMLQKVMNLTTVRTHQFAVWITIGFFEVLKPGSASLGTPDYLGGEIGQAAGRNIRYRSFFLLDRTRATGYDPSEPGDFRDVVTYRRRIE